MNIWRHYYLHFFGVKMGCWKEIAYKLLGLNLSKSIAGQVVGRLCLFLINLFSNGNIEVVPIEWMDEVASEEGNIVKNKEVGSAYAPRDWKSCCQSKQDIFHGDVLCRPFSNVIVSSRSSSVIDKENKKVVIERVLNGNTESFVFSAGHIVMHSATHAVVRTYAVQEIDAGIFLGGNGSGNYYHWLIEMVPKFECLEKMTNEFVGYPILVDASVESIPSFKEILAPLVESREVVYLDSDISYLVHDLIYIDAVNNLPFNFKPDYKLQVEDFFLRKSSISYLRRIHLEDSVEGAASSKLFPKKVFLLRGNSRRGYNQREVMEFLAGYGFEGVLMEGISFSEQVKLINNAEWIVGPTGAAWSNIVFAQESVKCLCWMADEYGDFAAFSTLAKLSGADMRYLRYAAGVSKAKALYNHAYEIDIDKLKDAIHSFEGC